MTDLQALATFIRVARTGSFTAVAAELGVGQPAISKSLQRLEGELGVRLLERTSQGVHPTQAGEVLLRRAQQLLDLAEETEAEVRQLQQQPVGRLRVALPSGFGLAVVVPLLDAFAQRYPRLELDLHLSDAWIDLMAEGIDVAVRIGPLGDSQLISKRLGVVRRLLVASPAWCATHGLPERPADLEAVPCVMYSGVQDRHHWTLVRGEERVRVQVRSAWRANHIDALRAGAIAGRGVGLLPDWGCAEALADGRLVRVLPSWEGESFPLSAVWQPGVAVPAKTRAFVDYLAVAIQGGFADASASEASRDLAD